MENSVDFGGKVKFLPKQNKKWRLKYGKRIKTPDFCVSQNGNDVDFFGSLKTIRHKGGAQTNQFNDMRNFLITLAKDKQRCIGIIAGEEGERLARDWWNNCEEQLKKYMYLSLMSSWKKNPNGLWVVHYE